MELRGGRDNPKLCLIARVKMASRAGAAWLLMQAAWRGIGLGLGAFSTFVLPGVTVGLSRRWLSACSRV